MLFICETLEFTNYLATTNLKNRRCWFNLYFKNIPCNNKKIYSKLPPPKDTGILHPVSPPLFLTSSYFIMLHHISKSIPTKRYQTLHLYLLKPRRRCCLQLNVCWSYKPSQPHRFRIFDKVFPRKMRERRERVRPVNDTCRVRFK